MVKTPKGLWNSGVRCMPNTLLHISGIDLQHTIYCTKGHSSTKKSLLYYFYKISGKKFYFLERGDRSGSNGPVGIRSKFPIYALTKSIRATYLRFWNLSIKTILDAINLLWDDAFQKRIIKCKKMLKTKCKKSSKSENGTLIIFLKFSSGWFLTMRVVDHCIVYMLLPWSSFWK